MTGPIRSGRPWAMEPASITATRGGPHLKQVPGPPAHLPRSPAVFRGRPPEAHGTGSRLEALEASGIATGPGSASAAGDATESPRNTAAAASMYCRGQIDPHRAPLPALAAGRAPHRPTPSGGQDVRRFRCPYRLHVFRLRCERQQQGQPIPLLPLPTDHGGVTMTVNVGLSTP